MIAKQIAEEIGQPLWAVENVISLMDEGNTIPFIARYRKEAHGAMDDTALRALEDRLNYLRKLEERKEEILKSIESQGKLTEELKKAVTAAKTLSEAEDLYRPYKQKRRTRAMIAREKGLEPLADLLFKQAKDCPEPETEAANYLNPEAGVETPQDALAGASDIIAERISDDPKLRKDLRAFFQREGSLNSRAAKEEDSVYSNYYEFSQSLAKAAGYQVLALNRGEKEGFLKVSVEADKDRALSLLEKRVIKPGSRAEEFVRGALRDGYERLLFPSMENEIRAALTADAAEGAIGSFATNLRQLLMQPPVKGKVTMGLDPGYRMGCKVAVVDETGRVLDTSVVYPTLGEAKRKEAIEKLTALVKKHHVEHIAIGNGTASRETECMAADMLKGCPGVSYMVVNEAGASVYSASELAAKEFPQYDVNLRSAISIARRLQDPLSELVKIEPKAIGVGQYQHDMPQKRLEEALDGVVEDCVNAVGVDINTASVPLLSHVAGLNGAIAANLVAYREENGAYTSRKQFKKVPKLGPKAFEQCAGFLRIPESDNLLERSGIHPESYEGATKLLSLFGFTPEDVEKGEAAGLKDSIKKFGEAKAAEACGIGVPTMWDIAEDLLRPGRDPRESLPAPIFRKDLLDVSDLKEGMELTGTVRNVVDFGAFVDIGVHQDGLVHVSQISDGYVKHPSDVLSVGNIVPVVVLGVDEAKKRISLSIKQAKGRA
ncbi:MAG: RNA-binding transcriptional accessory protein [Lachnospiraceae bacterium]|nr:RNA-binding transcriptional accessory protein [Lachnospiraceae bacterium]